MFRERWPIGLLAAILVASGLLYWEWQKPEMYRTEATLLFEPRTDSVVPIEEVVDTSLEAGKLNTHLEWIQSQSFYEYVASFFSAEEEEMIQRAYIDPDHPEAPPPSIAAIIRPNVSAYIRRNTTIIGITVRHKDPEVAAFIADRYARRYIDFNLDHSVTGTQSAIVFLQDQSNELRERVSAAERELQEYRGKHNVASLEENQNIVLQRVNRLGEEIVTAQIQRFSLESDLTEIEDYLAAEEELTEVPFIKDYGNIAGLMEQRDNLKDERRQLALDYLPRHPNMVENQRSLDSVEERIERNVERAIADLRGRHAAALQHEERLETELTKAEKESLEMDRLAVQYRSLEREAEAARDSFAQIVRRLNDTNIASQLENINIRPFDSAYTPGASVEPDMTKMAVQSALLGFLLLVGVPIGIGLIDNRLKSSVEVEELWGGKPLGEIPRIRGKAKRRPHVVLEGTQEAACQAFLGIYSQLEISDQKRYPNTILVSSTLPREGKSFVSNNLAMTFAQHGKKTLLIDCDFRAPSINGFYGKSNKEGLLKALQAPKTGPGATLDSDVLGLHCPHENLDVIHTGGSHRSPSRLFDHESLGEFFTNVKRQYDVVILDTPPLGIFPDALLLSRFVDDIFLVCRFNRVNKTRLATTVEKIQDSNVRFGGVIVNAIPPGRRSAAYDYHGFGSYGNRDYEKYYSTAAK